MASLRTQNALLFVIAACLVLIVVHFYSGHLIAKAQAKDGGNVVIYGCAGSSSNLEGCANPKAVQVDGGGYLLTKPAK